MLGQTVTLLSFKLAVVLEAARDEVANNFDQLLGVRRVQTCLELDHVAFGEVAPFVVDVVHQVARDEGALLQVWHEVLVGGKRCVEGLLVVHVTPHLLVANVVSHLNRNYNLKQESLVLTAR